MMRIVIAIIVAVVAFGVAYYFELLSLLIGLLVIASLLTAAVWGYRRGHIPAGPLHINGLTSCALGALLCGLFAWLQYSTNFMGVLPEYEIAAAILVFVFLYAPGFWMPGGVITPTNYARLYGIVGAQYFGVEVHEGPCWQPWFLLVWTITSIGDQTREAPTPEGEAVPPYFFFAGRRSMLPEELSLAGTAPTVLSADNVEVVAPISGDYVVVNGRRYLKTQTAEATIRKEVLANLRNSAARFAYVDIIRMKTVMTALISGSYAVLVLRENDGTGDRGHIVDDIYGAPIFVKHEVPFRIGVEAELEAFMSSTRSNRLKDKLVAKYNKGRPATEHKDRAHFDGTGAFDLVYTAGNMVKTCVELGVELRSIQTIDAAPTSQDILDAGAGIESAKLDAVAALVRNKGAATSAAELRTAMGGDDSGFTKAEALFMDRVLRGITEEKIVRGEGDALNQFIAAIVTARAA